MARQIRVTIRNNRIPAVMAAMRRNAGKAVLDTCDNIARDAFTRADVITEAMRESIYVIVRNPEGGIAKDTYMAAATSAKGRNPSAYIEPEVQPESNKIQGVVGVSVNYAQYEEIARGHKFLLPAADANKTRFEQAMSQIANV